LEEIEKMKRKRFLSLALAGTLSLSALATPALAVEASPSSVSDFDSLISELSAEEDEVANQLETLQADMEHNEAEAEELVAEMTETQEFLESLQVEVEELKDIIEKREAQLNEQARGVQVMGETGNIVSFILNADSLNDIVGRLDVVSTLISSNKQTVAQQKEDQELVEAKENETLEKQEEQNQLAAKLEANKAALEEQKAEQESILARKASEKEEVEEERSALVAQAEAAEERRKSLEVANSTAASADVEASEETNEEENVEAEGEEAATDSEAVTTSSTSSAPAPAPSTTDSSVVGIAQGLQGIPYVYGGGSTSGFDCSGFTTYVFAQAGRSLPRTAAAQYGVTSRISRSEAQPGDLVFFSQGGGVDHVGIYMGGGNFIGAQTSTGVAVSTIDSGYWANHVTGFGR
jgi:cell wall-associated NlpC family hydrolase